MAVGRISGPLLKANLLRNGVDLAFENDLLYLDVNNSRIGINSSSPTHDLTVNGTTRTANLTVDTQADIADITIQGNTISSSNSLNLLTQGTDTVVYQRQLDVQSISIFDNIISTNESNANLELRPNGTGSVEVFSNMNVDGDIFATGNITANGNVTIGDADTDNVVFNADISSDLIPDQDDTYQLGTLSKRWSNIWVGTFSAENVDTGTLQVDGVDLGLRQGNIVYVATNGDDTKTGTHPNDPVASIKHAMTIATAGTTIHVYPGSYVEEFPIEVKTGVNIKGESLRNVTVSPTSETQYNDVFLMNGETTIEDITVSGFYSGGNFYAVTSAGAGTTTFNVGTAPFAHTYVSGGTITINGTDYAVTGATYNNSTGDITVTHAGPDATGLTIFLSGLVFSCNGGNRTFPDNGYAFRFAADFEVTTRSPYIKNVTVITEGSVTSASDPRGFDAGDAGKGVYVDGAYATANSKEAAMLFHSVTFICPGVDAVTATNGARIEWLNSFTYFANRSIYAYDSNDGLKGDGKTALRVTDVTGTYSAGETVTYYDTDGTTVLATGTIETVDADGKFYIDGKNTGWELPSQRTGKTVTVAGDAQITSATSKFGVGSLVLDGTGDYLSIASNDDFGFSTGDFTLEAYVYKTADTGQESIFDFRTQASDNAVAIGVRNANKPYVYVNGTYQIDSATALTLNAWNHIAYVREGSTGTLYLNGTSVGSWVDNTDYGTTKPLIIGAGYTGSFTYWTGNIDEVRVVKGEAKYTTAFTPSTLPFLSDDNTVLLLHFDDISGSTTIVDAGISGQDIRFSGGATATKTTLIDHSDFGAEIRLIGSASVYGNYGLVGDGPGVIMYAIGHNVAYIGNGKDVDNDPNTVIQANEVVATDNAKIYYSTVDHKGDFRVGDLFYIDQENGAIQFSNASFNIDTTNGIEITDGTNTTLIKGDKIETGNWRLSGNTAETLVGDANITAASGQINLQDNVNITGNLDVTGNVSIAGNITIGDQSTDSITFVANIDSGMIPNVDATYDLGSASLRWKDLWANRILVDSIEINDNYIQTVDSNADLELRANGTGRIYIPTNNVVIEDTLTVNGSSTFQDITVNGDIDITGNLGITGDISVTGNVSVTQTLTVDNTAQFENIQIDQNNISTTVSNSDLELRAAGTGEIVVPVNNVIIENDLTVNGTTYTQDIINTGSISSTTFTNNDILISANTISTTQSNSDLVLRANGTGEIRIDTSDVTLGQDLTVLGLTDLQDTEITGTLTHVGNTVQTGDVNLAGNLNVTGIVTIDSAAQFENILINDNFITTTLSNSDLELRANGTGIVLIPNNNVEIANNLTVNGSITSQNLTAITSVTAATFDTGDINIYNNVIETTLSNSDLELRAAGAGIIAIDSNDVEITNNLTVNGLTTLANTNITGTVTHVGNTTQTGDIVLTGDLSVSGTINLASAIQLEEILIDDNVITTTSSNADLDLRAAGTGRVIVPSNDVILEQDVTVEGQLNTQVIVNTNSITAATFTTGDIDITSNQIQTTLSNSDLVLSAAGTGVVSIPSNNVSITNDLTVNGLTTLDNTVVNGSVTQTGNYTITGNTTINGNYTVTGLFNINSEMQFENILINDNVITTTASNSDLELRAAGTGVVLVPSNDVEITNNLSITGTTTTTNIQNSGTVTSNVINTDDINITGNTISVTTADTDLVFDANGTGVVRFENAGVNFNSDLTVLGTTTLATTNVTGTLTHVGNTVQTGSLSVSNNVTVTGNLTVTNVTDFEDVRIEQNFITTTLSNSNLELGANGIGVVTVPNNDVDLGQNLNVSGTITSGNIVNANTVTSDVFTTGDITITDNTITTTTSNSNLELRASGTGIISIPNNNVSITNDLTVSGLTTLGNTDIAGTITHVGDTTQTGDYSVTGNILVTNDLTVGAVAQFNDVRIETNFITTTQLNSDLILRANGTGIVRIPSNDVEVNGNVTVSGGISTTSFEAQTSVTSPLFTTGALQIFGTTVSTSQSATDLILEAGAGSIISVPNNSVTLGQDLTVTGLTTLGNTNITGTVTHTGDYTQTGNTTINGNLNVAGAFEADGNFQFEEILINDNYITTTTSNADLELRASGTGEVLVPTNDVRFLQGLTVEGSLIVNNSIVSNSLITTDRITTGDIVIEDNYITTTNSNSNLELRAAGTGSIDLGVISFNDNAINVSTGNDLEFNLGTGNVVKFNSTESIVLPAGTTLERPAAPVVGMIRFNTDIADYEGYNGTSWRRLGGVYDADENTRITAELTTGANDGVIRFYSNGTLVSTLDSVGLTTPKIEIDNIVIENSTITTVAPNTDINISANGTGSVNLEHFEISGSTITNIANNTNTTIVQTGTGYIKFGDSEGFVIPVGDSTQRPAAPVIGVTRFNTTDSRVEIWDGSNWVSVAGSQSGISRTDAENLAFEIVLSLG